MYEVKKVMLDGQLTWKFRCPGCKTWGYLDEDQANGRVSIQCVQGICGFHKTLNLQEMLEGG